MSDDVLGLEERTERADRESARGTSTADEHAERERRARAGEPGGRGRADEPRRAAGEPTGRARPDDDHRRPRENRRPPED
ncbi:hypothetical protein, partial [Nocardia neocaledoniensis]|uniref:hypothetical protein n=1 Tax=Nocardia neocaledoniensis TaxID=236511 RepID=UPI003D78E67A